MSTSAAKTKKPLALRQVFARNLRLQRLHLGMSQEALADEAGLDRTFVGTVERAERNVSIDNVERLCKAVGVPAHVLMDGKFAQEKGLDEAPRRAPRSGRG